MLYGYDPSDTATNLIVMTGLFPWVNILRKEQDRWAKSKTLKCVVELADYHEKRGNYKNYGT